MENEAEKSHRSHDQSQIIQHPHGKFFKGTVKSYQTNPPKKSFYIAPAITPDRRRIAGLLLSLCAK
ncbi:MAG: hypothetical protein ACREQR_12845 [Candidatus Binataceae bacterium]